MENINSHYIQFDSKKHELQIFLPKSPRKKIMTINAKSKMNYIDNFVDRFSKRFLNQHTWVKIDCKQNDNTIKTCYVKTSEISKKLNISGNQFISMNEKPNGVSDELINNLNYLQNLRNSNKDILSKMYNQINLSYFNTSLKSLKSDLDRGKTQLNQMIHTNLDKIDKMKNTVAALINEEFESIEQSQRSPDEHPSLKLIGLKAEYETLEAQQQKIKKIFNFEGEQIIQILENQPEFRKTAVETFEKLNLEGISAKRKIQQLNADLRELNEKYLPKVYEVDQASNLIEAAFKCLKTSNPSLFEKIIKELNQIQEQDILGKKPSLQAHQELHILNITKAIGKMVAEQSSF